LIREKKKREEQEVITWFHPKGVMLASKKSGFMRAL
jgi:hypothetical protein